MTGVVLGTETKPLPSNYMTKCSVPVTKVVNKTLVLATVVVLWS